MGTMEATSKECTMHMRTDKCNACGHRFWNWPPHFSGNFWRVQCSYIRELKPVTEIEPLFRKAYESARAPLVNMTFTLGPSGPGAEPWLGLDRYHSEQWLGSNPNFEPCPKFVEKILHPKSHNLSIDESATYGRREYYQLPGILWKFATIYNDTAFPPEQSWIWKFPDGMKYREAVLSLGSMKGAVQHMIQQASVHKNEIIVALD